MRAISKKVISYRTLILLLPSLILSFITYSFTVTDDNDFFSGKWYAFVIAFFVIMLLGIIVAYFSWKFEGYGLEADKIYYQRGIIVRKKSSILLENMQTVTYTEGLIEKIFGLATIRIDSGSANTLNDEIRFQSSKSDIIEFYTQLNKKEMPAKKINDSQNQKKFTYQKGLKNLYLYTALLIVIVVLLMLVGFLIGGVIAKAEGDYYLFVVGIWGGILVFSLLISMLALYLSFYKYEVISTDTELLINYGFFIRHNNCIKKREIRAIQIHENLFQKILGIIDIKLHAVGYVNENNNNEAQTGILLPYLKKQDLKTFLTTYLPEYSFSEPNTKGSKSLGFYLWYKLIILVGIFIISLFTALGFYLGTKTYMISLMIVLFSFIALAIIFLIILLNDYLEFKGTSLSKTNDLLVATNGGLSQNTYVIKVKRIVAFTECTTYLRKKHAVASYNISFYANYLLSNVCIKMVDVKTKDYLLTLLNY